MDYNYSTILPSQTISLSPMNCSLKYIASAFFLSRHKLVNCDNVTANHQNLTFVCLNIRRLIHDSESSYNILNLRMELHEFDSKWKEATILYFRENFIKLRMLSPSEFIQNNWRNKKREWTGYNFTLVSVHQRYQLQVLLSLCSKND